MGLKTEFAQLDLILDELKELKNSSNDRESIYELIKYINTYKNVNSDTIIVEDKEEFMLTVEELLSNQLDTLYCEQINNIRSNLKALVSDLSTVKQTIGKVVYEMSNKALDYVYDALEKGLLKHYYELSIKVQKDIDKITVER